MHACTRARRTRRYAEHKLELDAIKAAAEKMQAALRETHRALHAEAGRRAALEEEAAVARLEASRTKELAAVVATERCAWGGRSARTRPAQPCARELSTAQRWWPANMPLTRAGAGAAALLHGCVAVRCVRSAQRLKLEADYLELQSKAFAAPGSALAEVRPRADAHAHVCARAVHAHCIASSVC